MAVVGVLGFSFKAILIKLAYAWAPIDAVSLLALRMIYATPFFLVMAIVATRRRAALPIAAGDWLRILWLGYRLLPREPGRFHGFAIRIGGTRAAAGQREKPRRASAAQGLAKPGNRPGRAALAVAVRRGRPNSAGAATRRGARAFSSTPAFACSA